MIKYRTETMESKVLESITCDVCKKEFNYKKDEDELEIQEFQYIRIRGGYGSVFGDGSQLKIDICQHCLKKLVGEYMLENYDD